MKIAAILFIAMIFPASLQAQEPSLEDLEQMGGELNSAPVTEVGQENQPASDTGTNSNPITKSPVPATARLGDEIDLKNRLKRVSEPNLFVGAPPVPGTLRGLALGEAPEEYEVQQGDSLYDICDQLIDEPDYWPKLWALNQSIANPHFVFPGMKLRFYAGDAENMPFLRVLSEDEILPVNKGGLVEAELVKEDISGMLMRSEIPENMQVIGPNEIGPVAAIDEMFVILGESRSDKRDTNVLIPAFIVSEKFPVLGTVVGGSTGSYLLDDGDKAILNEESKGSLQNGATYTVIRELGPIYRLSNNEFVGYRYEYISQLKISDKKDDISRGRVFLNHSGVAPGDRLIAYRSVKRTIPHETPAPTSGKGQELVAFTEPMMEVGGRGSFAFIEQGAGKLQEGAVYQLTQNAKASASAFIRDQLPDTTERVGEVFILDASSSVALGFITHDYFELRIGDKVR